MLLLLRNILGCDIHKIGAQYSWDTRIVDNSTGDVGGLAPKGHTMAHRTINGELAPKGTMEHRCQLFQRLKLGVVRQ